MRENLAEIAFNNKKNNTGVVAVARTSVSVELLQDELVYHLEEVEIYAGYVFFRHYYYPLKTYELLYIQPFTKEENEKYYEGETL